MFENSECGFYYGENTYEQTNNQTNWFDVLYGLGQRYIQYKNEIIHAITKIVSKIHFTKCLTISALLLTCFFLYTPILSVTDIILRFYVPFTRPIACHITVYQCQNVTRLISNLCKYSKRRDDAAVIYKMVSGWNNMMFISNLQFYLW